MKLHQNCLDYLLRNRVQSLPSWIKWHNVVYLKVMVKDCCLGQVPFLLRLKSESCIGGWAWLHTQQEQLCVHALFFDFCVIHNNPCELFMASACGGGSMLSWYHKSGIYKSLGTDRLMSVSELPYLMICSLFLGKEILAKLLSSYLNGTHPSCLL